MTSDLVKRLHRPTYRWKVRQWIEDSPMLREAKVRLGDAIFNCRWNPPSWQYIEPLKDASAEDLVKAARLALSGAAVRTLAQADAHAVEHMTTGFVQDLRHVGRPLQPQVAAIPLPDHEGIQCAHLAISMSSALVNRSCSLRIVPRHVLTWLTATTSVPGPASLPSASMCPMRKYWLGR